MHKDMTTNAHRDMFTGRLRALLMPLTSKFSITKNNWQWREAPRTPNRGGVSAGAETPMYRTIHTPPELHEAGRDQGMPPREYQNHVTRLASSIQ
jgi:hypothetical protein